MIYDLSLQAGGFITGIVLILLSVPGLVKPGPVQNWLKRFPRSGIAGVVLLTLTLVWSFWLLATMEMGEFSSFRRPLMVVLPIGYVLVLRFVAEFLAVRALGILALLAAEPLLEAAFFRYETSRLVLTVLAYILIVLGLIWVTLPYKLRDQINWFSKSTAHWRSINAISFVYGLALIALAFISY